MLWCRVAQPVHPQNGGSKLCGLELFCQFCNHGSLCLGHWIGPHRIIQHPQFILSADRIRRRCVDPFRVKSGTFQDTHRL